MPKSMASLMLIFVLVLVPILLSPHFMGQHSAYTVSDEGSQWISWASKAWRYFQPGVAVDPDTGLSQAGIGWPYFTDWDLATYIFGILDAEKLGIISRGGSWGADDRINKIVSWLQTRELTANSISYLWYDSRTSSPALGLSPGNAADYGALLVALHRVKEYRPDLAATIDYVVKTRENTAKHASAVAAQKLYDYYIAHGFKYFGFDNHQSVVDALAVLKKMMAGPKVDVYGIPLPKADITSEPVLLGMFTLDPDPVFGELARNVYLAQERRYDATGDFTAFSEGNTGLAYPGYVYEWVVTGKGTTWEIEPTPITPIIYLKVAVGFEALYNTSYTEAMVEYVNGTFPDYTFGYYDGVDEDGRLVDTIIDRTNGIILSAARYAIDVLSTPQLDGFPAPFIDPSGSLNVTFIIGDTVPHGSYGWRAYTWDNLGAIGVANKLGRLSTCGDAESMLDSWIATYNDTTGEVVMLWDRVKTANLISIGSAAVNMLAYDFERFGATPFYLVWKNGVPYLHSDLTGMDYAFDWANSDYALIAVVQHRGKYILLAWGLTAYGTLAVSQLLQYFDTIYAGTLRGRAIIVKWMDSNGDGNVDLADSLGIIEKWP